MCNAREKYDDEKFNNGNYLKNTRGADNMFRLYRLNLLPY